MDGKGGVLSVRLGVLLARFGSPFPLVSGEALVGYVWRCFWDARGERLNMIVFTYVMFAWVLFLCYVLSSVAFLAAWPAAQRIRKNLERPSVCCGSRKPYVPFSRSARSNQISEGTRSKHRLNKSSKKRTHGTRHIHKQRA